MSIAGAQPIINKKVWWLH